jgi:hypothetical protein
VLRTGKMADNATQRRTMPIYFPNRMNAWWFHVGCECFKELFKDILGPIWR